MKKSILNFGKVLQKVEQKKIKGGGCPGCDQHGNYRRSDSKATEGATRPVYSSGGS
ncbi:hypothetical protein ABW636_04435 [Aquimarina sp. 2201CG1-2-11]|uniref:hypothetical protein n=1 Tax=Aquimarina discodermiae TaxID=3231043 RepID=UPI0034618F27